MAKQPSYIRRYLAETKDAPEHGITTKEDFDYHALEHKRNRKESIHFHSYTREMKLDYYINLMHVAVNVGDKQWFNELSRLYKEAENIYAG